VAHSEVAARYRDVMDRVDRAARAAGRDPAALVTIVVTKFHPAELVRELADLGHRDFGESRHQEARRKAADLDGLGLAWHFIGQLQSNKARAVREYASSIHSVDRDSLLTALATDGDPIDVFIEVNLTDDPGRGGVAPESLAAFTDRVLATPGVRLRGLMAVAGLGRSARSEFARVRELRDRVVLPRAPDATALSMGMSGDFEDAILEGATHLRIGTAITGNRPDRA